MNRDQIAAAATTAAANIAAAERAGVKVRQTYDLALVAADKLIMALQERIAVLEANLAAAEKRPPVDGEEDIISPFFR